MFSDLSTVIPSCQTTCTNKNIYPFKRQVEMKSGSMRDNLVIFNVPEREDENTEETLRVFIREILKMSQSDVETISSERVHRSGPKLSHIRPRKIVAKFSFHKQRKAVRALRGQITMCMSNSPLKSWSEVKLSIR